MGSARESVRKVKEGSIETDIYPFLTSEPVASAAKISLLKHSSIVCFAAPNALSTPIDLGVP